MLELCCNSSTVLEQCKAAHGLFGKLPCRRPLGSLAARRTHRPRRTAAATCVLTATASSKQQPAASSQQQQQQPATASNSKQPASSTQQPTAGNSQQQQPAANVATAAANSQQQLRKCQVAVVVWLLELCCNSSTMLELCNAAHGLLDRLPRRQRLTSLAVRSLNSKQMASPHSQLVTAPKSNHSFNWMSEQAAAHG